MPNPTKTAKLPPRPAGLERRGTGSPPSSRHRVEPRVDQRPSRVDSKGISASRPAATAAAPTPDPSSDESVSSDGVDFFAAPAAPQRRSRATEQVTHPDPRPSSSVSSTGGGGAAVRRSLPPPATGGPAVVMMRDAWTQRARPGLVDGSTQTGSLDSGDDEDDGEDDDDDEDREDTDGDASPTVIADDVADATTTATATHRKKRKEKDASGATPRTQPRMCDDGDRYFPGYVLGGKEAAMLNRILDGMPATIERLADENRRLRRRVGQVIADAVINLDPSEPIPDVFLDYEGTGAAGGAGGAAAFQGPPSPSVVRSMTLELPPADKRSDAQRAFADEFGDGHSGAAFFAAPSTAQPPAKNADDDATGQRAAAFQPPQHHQHHQHQHHHFHHHHHHHHHHAQGYYVPYPAPPGAYPSPHASPHAVASPAGFAFSHPAHAYAPPLSARHAWPQQSPVAPPDGQSFNRQSMGETPRIPIYEQAYRGDGEERSSGHAASAPTGLPSS